MSKFELSTRPKKINLDLDVFFVLHRNTILYDEQSKKILFSKKDLQENFKQNINENNFIYIGKLDEKDIYAVAEITLPAADPSLKFVTQLTLLDTLEEDYKTAIFRAFQLLNWNKVSAYCSNCGKNNCVDEREFVKVCSDCNQKTFPQYSPAVVFLIRHHNKLLLGRSAYFRPGIYSTLAGYVEAGEKLEDTVRREAREEVGVEVDNIRYYGSQPWPFPNTLMFAFTCDYKSGNLVVDKKELEDAQWFPINKLPSLPIKTTVSRKLIDDFVRNSSYNIYPHQSSLDSFVNGLVLGIINAFLSKFIQSIAANKQNVSAIKPAPFFRNSLIKQTLIFSSLSGMQTSLRNSYPLVSEEFRDVYEKLTHPVVASYVTGAIISPIDYYFPKLLNPQSQINSGRSWKSNIHQSAAFSCCLFGVYPWVRYKIAEQSNNSAVTIPIACVASSSFYLILSFAQLLYKQRSNLSTNKNSFKSIVRNFPYVLWRRAAFVGALGEIALKLETAHEPAPNLANTK